MAIEVEREIPVAVVVAAGAIDGRVLSDEMVGDCGHCTGKLIFCIDLAMARVEEPEGNPSVRTDALCAGMTRREPVVVPY